MAELNRSWLTVYGVSTEGEYCITCPRLERRVFDYTTRGRCGLMTSKSVDRPILTLIWAGNYRVMMPQLTIKVAIYIELYSTGSCNTEIVLWEKQQIVV